MQMRGLVRLSAETDRVYTINLGKVLLTADNRRAKRAINMIREFARHHMGVSEVKIDMDVSRIIWNRGIRHPPRKIRVHMHKTDEGSILISKYEAEPTVSSDKVDTQPKLSDTKKSTGSASKPKDAKPEAKSKPSDTKKSTGSASDKPKAKSLDTKKSTGSASKPKNVKPEAKSKPSDTKKSTGSASDDKESKTTS